MQKAELIQPLSQFLHTKDYPQVCDARHCKSQPEKGSLLCAKHIQSALQFFEDQLAINPIDHMKRDITLQYGQCWTYLVGSREHAILKIGMTTRLKHRMASLKNSSPVPIKLFAVVFGSPQIELELHEKFSAARQHGEWFSITEDLSQCIEDLKAGEFGKHIREGLFPKSLEQRVQDLVEGIKCRDQSPWSTKANTAIDFLV